MLVIEILRTRVADASVDAELVRLSPGLAFTLELNIGDEVLHFKFVDGQLVGGQIEGPIVGVSATSDKWEQVLRTPPRPTYHSFTALQIANPSFDVKGEPKLIAQARPALERIFELLVASPVRPAPPVHRSLSQVSGHYAALRTDNQQYEIYYETAGSGIPVMFLHTAGADSRQFIDQMSDSALAESFRFYAFDLPFHGKSLPPRNWDGSAYTLTAATYRDWCTAFMRQIIGAPAIVAGGSMGAAMALILAAERSADILGIVAIEPPFQSRGRRNPFQNHIEVHGGLHNGAYVRGIMSPTSPLENRRRASWIYAQGGPGVYPGDLAFYSDEFDGAVVAPRVDTRATPVALLSGTYDYSATPEDGARLAALIPGALHIVMDGLGHFPMIEHPDYFRPHLVRGLEHVVAARNRSITK